MSGVQRKLNNTCQLGYDKPEFRVCDVALADIQLWFFEVTGYVNIYTVRVKQTMQIEDYFSL